MATLSRSGFTLIEVLIVIAIITLLLQLTIPAVEMARESARQTQCQSGLRQIALGCLAHLDAQEQFPTGGWNSAWVGQSDRGYNKKQPGGWGYNILPYIEQQPLHDLGAGLSEPERRKAAAQMYGTSLPIFSCPSRRLARSQKFILTRVIRNADMEELKRANKAGRSDYAGNMGIIIPGKNFALGPSTLEEGDRWKEGKDPKKTWIASDNSGIIFQRSEVTPAMVTDGLSRTFLIGEKFVPAYYKTERTHCDDQSLYVGFSYDNNRACKYSTPPTRDGMIQVSNEHPKTLWRFGSAHPTRFFMACCDGSVHGVAYTVDIKVYSAMSTRSLNEKRQLD